MGKPKIQYVETTQKQELDPIAQAYLWSGQLPMEKMKSLRRINEQVYGYAPGTLTPVPTAADAAESTDRDPYKMSPAEERRQEEWIQAHIDDVNSRHGLGSSSGSGGYTSLRDMFDRGGPGQSGGPFKGGGFLSDIANAVTGRGLETQKKEMATGGIVALARGGYVNRFNRGSGRRFSNQMPGQKGGPIPSIARPPMAAPQQNPMGSPSVFGSPQLPVRSDQLPGGPRTAPSPVFQQNPMVGQTPPSSPFGNASSPMGGSPYGQYLMANGGIVALANGGMVPPMISGRMPNLSNRDMAYHMAMRAQGYAMGGYIEGPGTGTSDSIPAKIYQDGKPVQEAALSDGEFVMTKKAVDGAGGPARMYEMMRRFERGGRVG